MIHRAFGPLQDATFPRPSPVATPPEPFELAACYRYCEGLARARHHNYPVASRFVPEFLRPHIFAIYGFVRAADDFADEPAFEGRRARELDRWEQKLWACFHGEVADHPIFVALSHTIATFDLPITPFSQLLAGFRADLETRRYSTYRDLRAYTAMAAEPVGHLFLYLFGYRDPALLRYAEDLASALALANFWQDLGTDVARGRLYVPEEDLRHFGVSERDLLTRDPSPQVDALIRFEVARTRALFLRARPLVDAIGDDFAVECSLMWHGGMRILSKIERKKSRAVAQRPVLHAGDKAEVVARALAWRGGALIRRAARAARRGGPRR